MQTEIVIAGFGGQGILFTGQILAHAGLKAGQNVTWLPSYGPEMRGGTANVIVIISNEEIGSPIVQQPQIAMIFNLPSLQKYEPLIKPGGTLVYDNSLIDSAPRRSDINLIAVPAGAVAQNIGDPKTTNMVILGAMIAATRILPVETVVKALRDYLSCHGGASFEADEAALRRGARLVEPLPVR